MALPPIIQTGSKGKTRIQCEIKVLLINVLPGLSTGGPKGKIALVAYRQSRIIESARVLAIGHPAPHSS